MVALVEGLNVENLPVLDGQFGMRNHVLDLKINHGKALPDTHSSEQAADVLGLEKGFGGRLAPCNDQLP